MYFRQVAGFNIDINIIFIWNKFSKTSNMFLPISDSFYLITSHVKSFSLVIRLDSKKVLWHQPMTACKTKQNLWLKSSSSISKMNLFLLYTFIILKFILFYLNKPFHIVFLCITHRLAVDFQKVWFLHLVLESGDILSNNNRDMAFYISLFIFFDLIICVIYIYDRFVQINPSSFPCP